MITFRANPEKLESIEHNYIWFVYLYKWTCQYFTYMACRQWLMRVEIPS